MAPLGSTCSMSSCKVRTCTSAGGLSGAAFLVEKGAAGREAGLLATMFSATTRSSYLVFGRRVSMVKLRALGCL